MHSVQDWTSGEPRLVAYRCENSHVWYFPRFQCPNCGLPGAAFDASGPGTAFAVTSIHRRSDGESGSIRIALVDLDSGVRVMTRALDGVSPGTRVQVDISQASDSNQLFPTCEALS